MNKRTLLIIPLLLFITGCFPYAVGRSFGYITTQESGWCSQNLWFRAELESSNTDCYTLDSSLTQEVRQLALDKARVEIKYDRHVAVICGCSRDVIVEIKRIN